ncbi:unnamed protein product [Rangifer tarandus platyrhynchus]|uniref:Uncharacterized protein n=1 Tax=Rangifer tarandus platyrhynchus TaxID=3082113 RepID=A0AC60A6N9_RANTA
MGRTFRLHTLVGSRRHLVPTQLCASKPGWQSGLAESRHAQKAPLACLLSVFQSDGPLHSLRPYLPSLQTLDLPGPSTRLVIFSVAITVFCPVVPIPPPSTSSHWGLRE